MIKAGDYMKGARGEKRGGETKRGKHRAASLRVASGSKTEQNWLCKRSGEWRRGSSAALPDVTIVARVSDQDKVSASKCHGSPTRGNCRA